MIEQNRIYNGDCLCLLGQIEDRSIDLVVTDPPYLFDNGNWYKSDVMGEKTLLGKGSIYDSDGTMKTDMGAFGDKEIDQLLTMLMPKMKIPNCYFFCCEEQVPLYTMWARNHGLHYQILVWEKPLSIINKNRFSMNAEFVVRIYDFGTALNSVKENELYNRVLHDKPMLGKDKIHPTQKSVSMYRKFILLSSKENDVVLDPFAGSGTCAEACIKERRQYICFEKNEQFFKKSVQRIEALNSQLTLF